MLRVACILGAASVAAAVLQEGGPNLQDGVLMLPDVENSWQNWSLFGHDTHLIKLQVPVPSGILLSEVFLNGTLLRVGRLGHSALSIREEWSEIHSTGKAVLSLKTCEDIIKRTEEYVAVHGWTTDRHPQYPTTDIPLKNVFPEGIDSQAKAELDAAIEIIFQEFADKLKLKRDRIFVADLFVAKYDATVPGRQVHLEPHQDKHMLSFVMALNDDFTDGGTYFFSTGELWVPRPGAAILFHGMHWHAGHHIATGVRYIIAGFCDYGDDSIDQFMELYLPETDGYAAGAGFKNHDILRGLDECTIFQTSTFSEAPIIHHNLRNVDGIIPAVWSQIASSCEKLDPHTPMMMIVERRKS